MPLGAVSCGFASGWSGREWLVRPVVGTKVRMIFEMVFEKRVSFDLVVGS